MKPARAAGKNREISMSETTIAPGPYTVGLTGGIGSGKTTVANLFGELGVALIDTDVIAHQITAPGGIAIAPIRAAFGEQALNAEGAMDRARMRTLAFSDDSAKRTLEAILHPLIAAESRRQRAAATSPYVMLVIPLLFESGSWNKRMQRTLLVDCPEDLQISRVMQRSGLGSEQIRAIMAKQMTRAGRLALADDVIDNAGDGSNLAGNVRQLHERYLELAHRHGVIVS